MSELLNKLLASEEGEHLDFKSEWHQNLGSLIHDVLCLANSRHKGDKYLVIGVRDDGQVVGVQPANRKNQAQLINFIQDCCLNIMPTVRVKTFTHETHEIDVVEIKPSLEKPYFLTQDYSHQGVRVRAGVVYSRVADTNTPIDGCLDDKKIEEMYRERFRLDQTPLQRLSYLLDDLTHWEYNSDRTPTFFYSYWPEMRISQTEESSTDFHECWACDFSDPNGFRTSLEVIYFGTVLERFFWVSCDGGRCQFIQPSLKAIPMGPEHWRKFYYYVKGSLACKLNDLLQRKYSLHERTTKPEIIVFDSQEQADLFFESDATNAQIPYGYYEQTGSGDTYQEHVVHPSGHRHRIRMPTR